MSAPVVIRAAITIEDIARVRQLVHAHANARSATPGVSYVRADADALPGPYVPPGGGLWLALVADEAIGCVALRPLPDARAGEVKRMFVETHWRGHGVGRALMETVIAAARERRYTTLRLGTLDDMDAAKSLYRSLGFVPIDRYRPDEMVDTRFFELVLT